MTAHSEQLPATLMPPATLATPAQHLDEEVRAHGAPPMLWPLRTETLTLALSGGGMVSCATAAGGAATLASMGPITPLHLPRSRSAGRGNDIFGPTLAQVRAKYQSRRQVVNTADAGRGTVSAFLALLIVSFGCWIVGLYRNGWVTSSHLAAMQSGARSWTTFLSNSLDRAQAGAVESSPASLWPMKISAKLAALSDWSVALPQVLLGVASVTLLVAIVKRHFGTVAGLIAGFVLALTSLATMALGGNHPDVLPVFLMIAAVWSLVRNVGAGRTRWRLACVVFVGLAFLTNPAQVLVILIIPALALGYLTAPPPYGYCQRIGGLVAGPLVVAVPTVGLALSARTATGPAHAAPATAAGWIPLLARESAAPICALLPAALVFLVVGLFVSRRAHRSRGHRAQYLLWGSWLLGGGFLTLVLGRFSDDTLALAPAVAAMVGIGVVHLWNSRQHRLAGLALPATAALTAAWSWLLLDRVPYQRPPLQWFVLIGGAAAAAILLIVVLAPTGQIGHRVTAWAATLASAAALAGPIVYFAQVDATGPAAHDSAARSRAADPAQHDTSALARVLVNLQSLAKP